MRLTDKFDLQPSHRALIVGMTGTGKTELCCVLASEMSSIIVLDYKHELDWVGFKVIDQERELKNVGRSEEWSRVIFQIPLEWEKADYDKFFKWVVQRRNTRVVCDEGMVIGDSGSSPKHLKINTVVGRSRNNGMLFNAQRPVTIPKFIFTNSEHKFIFYVAEDDRERIEKELGGRVPWELIPHGSYAFIHHRAGRVGFDGPYTLDLDYYYSNQDGG